MPEFKASRSAINRLKRYADACEYFLRRVKECEDAGQPETADAARAYARDYSELAFRLAARERALWN